MADEYSFDFADVRANDNASVVAGGDQCLVDLPQRYYLLTTLTPGQLPRQVSTIDADLRSVQLVHLVVAQSRGFFVADGVDGPAVDSILHPQTLSYNADASEDSFVGGALGLHFHSMFAFVDVYAEVAKTGSRSDDVAPYFVYDEDIITLPNALFVAPYTAWNSVSILDLTVEANAAPWLRLFWLAYPLTPVVDMTDDDNDSPTMLRYMQNAAGRAFPDRYATSPRTAIAALLTVPETFNLPCELVHYDITLAARMSYVDLLVVWATGDRVLCVRDRFAWLLRHYGALQTWLEGATSKYLGASKLARAIVGDVDFDVDAIKALNVHLDAGTYDHLWSSSRTCDQNIDYVLAHVRRKHERRGMLFSDNKMIAHLLRGLMRRRLAAHGVALPVRAEPFTVRENLAMLDLHEGERLGRRVYAAASRYWRGWRCVNTYADQAGPRKQEIVGEPDMGFTRDDVQFHINGELHADPDPEVLRSMVNRRDRVTVRVGPSKADQDGTIFGPNLVVSLFNDTNPMAFANAIVDYELAFPCRGKQRAKTWLFTPDGSSRWSESAIDGTLRDIMAAKLTAAQRRQKTFHSKRVWVATGLKGLPEPSSDGEVQALVRWSSLESLRIYARMNHAYQARRRDELIHAEVDAVNATACPQIDDTPEDNARLAAEDGLLADAVDLDVAA